MRNNGHPGYMWSAEEQAILSYTTGVRAHEFARRHAANGVPVDIASQHGVRAVEAAYIYWWFAGIPTIFFAIFAWYPAWAFVWKVGLCVMAYMLYKRMRLFIDTDPRIRLRYRLRTGWLTTIFAVWAFCGTALWILVMMASTVPQ